jgi:hypothetical protein
VSSYTRVGDATVSVRVLVFCVHARVCWCVRVCVLCVTHTHTLLGDSTVAQAASTLMNWVHFGHWGEEEDVGGGCQEQIVYVLSDTLVGMYRDTACSP